MDWINPKLDWLTNPVNPTKTDLNRIEGDIAFLNTEIANKKGAIVDALVSVGVATLLTDTHAAIASKIVAAEKTGVSILPSTVNKAIPKGIYDTSGGIVQGDADLIAANILSGKNIFGVAGVSPRIASGRILVGTGGKFTISGLSFTPSFIVGRVTDSANSPYIDDSSIYIYSANRPPLADVNLRYNNVTRDGEYDIYYRFTQGRIIFGEGYGLVVASSGGFTCGFAHNGMYLHWVAIE